MSENDSFDDVDAGASGVEAQKAGKIRKGDHIVINGRPCRVAEVATSKTGKHGHAKAAIVGIDIFTNKKLETICPTSHTVETPVIKRCELMVSDIDEDGYLTLMDDDGNSRHDLKAEEDMIDPIRAALEAGTDTVLVSIVSAMDTEKVMEFKVVKD